MNSPEEYIKEQTKGYEGTIPGDVFYDICTTIAHEYDMPLEEATRIFYTNIGDLQVGEVLNKGVGKRRQWPGQNQAVNFSKSNPGALAEPMSSLLISAKDYEHGTKLPLAPGDLIVPELRSGGLGDLFQLAEAVFEDERLAKYPNKPSRLTSTFMATPEGKLNWLHPNWQSVDTSKIKVHDTDAQWIDNAEVVLLNELKTMREEYGVSPTHPGFNDVNFIDDAERVNFLKSLWGSDVEKIVRGYADKYWEGKVEPTPEDSDNPVSRPESLGEGKVTLKKVAHKIGDEVRVKKNDQAPWGAEYTGIIEKINNDNTFDIRDVYTETLNTSQPARLLAVPMATGREDLRIQQRRVGDPKGMGESAGDVGGHEVKQDYPNANWMPTGHPGQDVKNQQSNFYKEAAGSFKVGDKVTVAGNKDGKVWVSCHCGLYRQMVKPGQKGQFYYPDISGESGVILAVHPSNHEGSGFSFDCYDVLINDVDTYHLNALNLNPADTMRIKLEEPSKERLDDLKDEIAKAEKGGNNELAKQLLEQYLSLTSSDKLYITLLSNIAKNFDATSSLEVKNYMEGKIYAPSRSLKDILHKYNIVAAAGDPMLNVEKALGEVKDKTEVQINTETAWTWGSRAAACYKLSNETNNAAEKEKWVRLGDAYRHESLEHASLAEDDGKLVGEVSRALAPFRKPAGTPEK